MNYTVAHEDGDDGADDGAGHGVLVLLLPPLIHIAAILPLLLILSHAKLYGHGTPLWLEFSSPARTRSG